MTIVNFPTERIFQMGDQVILAGRVHEVTGDDEGLYLQNRSGSGDNSAVFNLLGLGHHDDKVEYVARILGYYNEGQFPVVNSGSDLNLLVNNLANDLALTGQETTKKQKTKVRVRKEKEYIDFSMGRETLRVYGNPLYMIKKVAQ